MRSVRQHNHNSAGVQKSVIMTSICLSNFECLDIMSIGLI